MHTTTRTFALLAVSPAAYEEIKAAILLAHQPERLVHVKNKEGVDLNGIVVVVKEYESDDHG